MFKYKETTTRHEPIQDQQNQMTRRPRHADMEQAREGGRMKEIWTAQNCADYLKMSRSSFVKKYQFKPGFPPRLANFDSPRWEAEAVRAWALAGTITRLYDYPPVTRRAASS